MSFDKIKARNTIVPQVYEQLKRAILRGTLPPGTRLVESRVAEDFGVSRTPVRDAISRLLAQGFVKEDGTAKVVADMATELHEIFGIRQVLEGYAARLAAEHATDIEIDEIDAVCHASIAAIDSTSIAERAALNNIFHGAIARASHRHRLIKIIGDFYEYAITEEMLPFYGRSDSETHAEQHLAILKALRARDGDAAQAAMIAHIQAVGATVEEAVRRVRSDENADMPISNPSEHLSAVKQAQEELAARLTPSSL
ncbi:MULTISPECIES: GntR family transcriptional regulator [unclassified Chelatococcus]|uniref:GntR family transcriptional regulator n=1 Tax=unclassified Chelatococcus TaxID=2638111 RepID=UPI001BCD3833|nr:MULTISPECIES: GntR family transcriptional regulator [unclassified Chelatococcus]CAH1654168.1 DNA-binding GntR family transcriptional regulator [Hyphomicrobiales bacterium]MBS7740214.1 GntR family transcriptional regulator [Chelatococcus sp. HY11]MBX3544957.1 GntR family transcriptional regulator [Chelatococcus sp.]MCO5078545.1 GntR family transcriptional regulator [Chelatococcus sp.]CAH1685496.1 DNA-binding GntR family transcriptional regulator [Hyphomicrobiales bacterium]